MTVLPNKDQLEVERDLEKKKFWLQTFW